MSRDRDPFERTLGLLRQRLRAGDPGMGQPLNIQKLAAAMAVSSTPVREALARLSGEGLIERASAGYLTWRYDVSGLQALYRLDQLYALAALNQPRGADAAPPGSWPASDDACPAPDTALERTEALLARLAPASAPILAAARKSLWDRLAPFRAAEPSALAGLEEEWAMLAMAAAAPASGRRRLIQSYYRRRLRAAAMILQSSQAGKYQSNIP